MHRVVPTDGLDQAVRETADAFLAGGPQAIAASKRLIRDATATLYLPDLARRITAARMSEEGREGLDAFLEKRPPSWAPSNDS